MTQYIINDTELLAIANSIRGKNGESTTYTVDEMPTAIDAIETGGGGGELPPEALVIDGYCDGMFKANNWNWFIDIYGNQITTFNLLSCNTMFGDCGELKAIPFSFDFGQNKYTNVSQMFSGCYNLTSIGKFINLAPAEMQNMFSYCRRLRYLPEFENFDMSLRQQANNYYAQSMFSDCYSLRSIDPNFLKQIKSKCAYSWYKQWTGMFENCYVIDEIVGMPVLDPDVALTTNYYADTFKQCSRIKNLIFDTNEDGTPKVANMTSQTIDLTYYVGYAMGWEKIAMDAPIMGEKYNSGITMDKLVTDAESYERLKNDPDWFTNAAAFSRYNHDSAVATINSLPDCSQVGGNVIKFRGECGSATDGGAINTLTADEIAVATAKGWTVTIV